jgi:hypothetical protein
VILGWKTFNSASDVDFSAYHHIPTSSSIHPAACGNDAHSPVSWKSVTDHCLVPGVLCPYYIHAVGQGHVYHVVAYHYNGVIESSPGHNGSNVLTVSAVLVQDCQCI